VDSERYLLTVHRYVELNPVRASMVAVAEDYRWSSVHASVATASDAIVTPHAVYLGSAPDPATRGVLHREWLCQGISDDDLRDIRMHMQQERALGNPLFQIMLARTLNRPVAVRARGRPRSAVSDPTSPDLPQGFKR